MKLPSTLRVRLLLSHLLVSVVSIVLISIYAGRSIFLAANVQFEQSLQYLAITAGNAVEYPLQEYLNGNVDIKYVEDALARMFADDPTFAAYTLYKPDLTPLVDSSGKLPPPADELNAPEVIEAFDNDVGQSVRTDASGRQVLYEAVVVQRENEILAIFRLGTPMEPALVAARRSLLLLILTALAVAIGMSLVGWFLAGSLARPIRSLTEAAGRLAQGDLTARVKPSGPSEFQRLAETFNTMAGRLQGYMDELRAFVANASHELRTPLTIVKLRAEALRDGALSDPPIAEQFLAEIEGEVDRLVVMVNEMLDLSRLEAGLTSAPRSRLEMSEVAAEVYETFNIRAARAGVSLVMEVDPKLPAVMGNEEQLRRVLYNILENAIKFTPEGGQVELTMHVDLAERVLRVLVRDSGIGIPSEHLPHVFERFYRAEATRPRNGVRGSGLGLAIAKSIVESHGGKIGVSSQVGKGTTVWLELPCCGEGE